MSRQRITIRIDQVSIDQVSIEGAHLSRAALADAIAAELHRSMAAPGALETLKGAGYAPRIDGGTIRPAAPGASGLGAAIAQATAGALKR